MMTALIIYAYAVGVFSSRRIERAAHEDVAFRVLKLCGRAGLKTVGHVALDGSKVQANASKHKAMSYGRMKEEEKRLQAEIEALLQRPTPPTPPKMPRRRRRPR